MANRNYASGGKLYSMHVKPVLLDCNFKVDSTNANGLGISGLKGPMIQNVFMHTTQAAGAGNSQIGPMGVSNIVVTNPNPAFGYIIVQLNDNYNQLFAAYSSIVSSPNSGSDVKIDNSVMTIGLPYVITTLGNASAAKWIAIGVPPGVTPAVGVAFIAKTNGGAGNTLTSRVQAVSAAGSGIFSIELMGLSAQNIAVLPSANQGYGPQFIFACRNDSAADAPVIAAPADGTIISIRLYLGDSSVQVQGE